MKIQSVLGILVLLLLGCQNSETKKTQTIYFSHYFSGSVSGGIDGLVKEFNQDAPAIQLEAQAVDHEAYKTRFYDMVKDSSKNQVLSAWAGEKTRIVAGFLQDLTPVWQKEGFREIFSSQITASAASYEGKIALIPLTQHLVGFFYNKAAFKKWGVEPPETYDQFLKLCEKLKGLRVTPLTLGAKYRWPAQFWFDYFLLRTAGLDFRENLLQGKESYESKEVQKVFALWKDLMDRGYFNKNPENTEWDSEAALQVIQGKAGMTLMGSWIIGYLQSLESQTGVGELGFFPFPILDKQIPPVGLGPVDGVVLPKGSWDPDTLTKLLRFFVSEKAQKAMSRGSGALSPNLRIPDTFYSPLQNEMRREIAKSAFWAFNYDLATPPKNSEKGLNTFVAFLKDPGAYPKLLKFLDSLLKTTD